MAALRGGWAQAGEEEEDEDEEGTHEVQLGDGQVSCSPGCEAPVLLCCGQKAGRTAMIRMRSEVRPRAPRW